MKRFLVIVLFLISGFTQACICVPLVPISKELCEKYDVIFYGSVDSVGPCDEKERAIAYFTVSETFRGKGEKQFKIYFDCVSECLMNFAADEEWIIYARYSKFDHLEVSLCEHSRKKFNGAEQDLYLVDSKRTFEDELKLLKTDLGTQEVVEPLVVNNTVTDIGRHNEQPGGWGKVILLLISLGVMGIVYFITRRKK